MDTDFSNCFNSHNVNDSWSLLKSIILEGSSLFVPKVKLKAHQPPKWFTPTIRHHLHRIHSLRKVVKSHPSALNRSKLHTEEINLEKLMSTAKIEYESTCLQAHLSPTNQFTAIYTLSPKFLLFHSMCG